MAYGNLCEICNRTESDDSPVLALFELEAGPRRRDDPVHLCLRCVQRREIDNWDQSTPEARAIEQAIFTHAQGRHGRFTFLEDSSRLRLLRLRTSWVERRGGRARPAIAPAW